MGAIHFRRIELVTCLNELVGYKAGIALTRDEMSVFLAGADDDLITGENDAMLRVRSEDFQALLCKLLYSVGNISSPDVCPNTLLLFKRLKADKVLFPIFMDLSEEWPGFLERGIKATLAKGAKSIDPTPFFDWAKTKHGILGGEIALQMLLGLNEDLHKSPLTSIRHVEWLDVTELDNLFASENLNCSHGRFLDQRFIDYLSHNFDSIDKIHWRKFEGLTCEFFHKEGFEVEIGKGRNDDSVDARIWEQGTRLTHSPLILVQCKRQKETIGKVIVKALYADILYEKADRGLIVTTSKLAPGAIKTCAARGYRVEEANRETLRTWIRAMRTPYKGIFLGE